MILPITNGDYTFEGKTIAIGNIIKAYHQGYHKVVSIERRYYTASDMRYSYSAGKQAGDEYNPCVTYITVADENGNKKNHKERSSDWGYCHVVDKAYLDDELTKARADLDKFEANMKKLAGII